MSSTVLVIDDDLDTIDFLTNMLQKQKYKVLTARSARRAVQLTREYFLDSIILVWPMPGAEGQEFFASIRHSKYIPVLILSSLDGPGMIARALDAGADDYLVKPVSSGMLLAHLNKMIRWTEIHGWKYTGQSLVQNTP